jgi:single-strand DNA-binding protein
MRGINKVILIGNAARDAELRFTGSGKAVASIRLATNRVIRGQEETQFHSVVCWEGLAETVAKFVKKGDPLYVEGRLKYRSYQDEEGKERGVAEIVAGDVQFLGRRKDETASDPINASTDSPDEAPRTAPQTDDVSPDEIPF